jgi:hypothetical protein
MMKKSLDKTAIGSRVPPGKLDDAVKAVKATRPYALESFTQRDWDEVRSNLPAEHRWLSNEQLMHQACNRRKQGAYSTKAKKSRTALWADVKKAVRSYWSGDTSLEELGDLKKLKPAASATDGPGQ